MVAHQVQVKLEEPRKRSRRIFELEKKQIVNEIKVTHTAHTTHTHTTHTTHIAHVPHTHRTHTHRTRSTHTSHTHTSHTRHTHIAHVPHTHRTRTTHTRSTTRKKTNVVTRSSDYCVPTRSVVDVITNKLSQVGLFILLFFYSYDSYGCRPFC